MSQAGKLARNADRKPWAGYMLEMYYRGQKPPALGTYSVDRIEQLAREKPKDRPG
ncbi:hypothetical protein PHLCEN_2v4597 [Hermanssonia centrifuga]|uniref:Uncharacterized protein n=1 Tax=Hermanssonia centrifuga TaxID=98765 RepID=A0A2R6PN48_9APHY|nr:hypothetical protein PHLCEN_2v4597 [Hermanssonia centrifuga]